MDMTIGEFSMATGLTPKALRIYDERGILVPTAVDPVTGYRWYSSEQVRRGQEVMALRLAGVPLTELDGLDVDAFRERLALRRAYEDTSLQVAEAIRGIRLDDWPVTMADAAEQAWVGTCLDVAFPEDTDNTQALLGYVQELSGHRVAIDAALLASGDHVDAPGWTTYRAIDLGSDAVELLVCAPVRDRSADLTEFAGRVRSSLGDPEVRVVDGLLPARIEVGCTAPPDPVDIADEMAAGYAPRLAVDRYISERGLRPLTRTTRELHVGDIFDGGAVTTVRDVALHG